jgi:hypothetical protein
LSAAGRRLLHSGFHASGVHLTNSNCPTIAGFSQGHSFIFSAVKPTAQRPLFASGRLANGHVSAARVLNRLNGWSRDAGVNPVRVRSISGKRWRMLTRYFTYTVIFYTRAIRLPPPRRKLWLYNSWPLRQP